MKNQFKNNPNLIPLLNSIDFELQLLFKDTSRRDDKSCLKIMEICGTHTVSILKHGFRQYFENRINFLSGPGCPVCVTSQNDIDKVIALAQKGVEIATFGDLVKVPGTESSLEREIANGARVHVLYNPLDCLELVKNTNKEVVFIAVGFETTIPVIASLVLDAKEKGIQNFSILSLVKTLPNTLKFLLENLDLHLDGFICPGHVSVVIGEQPYQILAEKYGIPSVISGFEPVDLGLGIESLVSQIGTGKAIVDNRYTRMVSKEGSPASLKLIDSVFSQADVSWRGFGEIPKSGLKLRKLFADFDVEKKFDLTVKNSKKPKDCICGEIITGNKNPNDCKLFRKGCTPDNPIGPCMVSFEGACSAFYKYGK
jgi:hydrogenase expression/formation protein HypD